ncbi:MAG: PH domain-containing protein [Clostridium sp.]|nr:PH domain-containing protein [Clostridium sp.]MCM1547518.1 PH domain-containing protein [Ruminococcus sp.]
MYHEHPIKILKYALKNIWLLIFPVLRSIKNIHLDINNFVGWLKGAWFDILVILVILGYGYIRWACTWIRFGDKEISQISGLFIKAETIIPYKNLTVSSKEEPFFLRLLRASRIKVNTMGGVLKKADMSLLLKKKDMSELSARIPAFNENQKPLEVHPKFITMIFFSFVFSSSLSGAAYISAFFFQIGRISEDFVEHEMINALDQITNEVSKKFAHGISPAAIAIGILIIATWIFSFISNILRYAGFSMKKNNSSIKVRMGAVTKRSYHIVKDKINYVDMHQSMIMKIFKKVSLNISCSGYGGAKNELPVLFPILDRKQTNAALDILDFGKKIGRRSIKASRSAVMTFLGIPLLLCIGIPVAAKIFLIFYPLFSKFVLPIAVMAEIPSVWICIVRIASLLSTGISFNDDFICIIYSKMFSFHTVLVHQEKIIKVQIIQNPIQKKLNRCRLDFYFSSEIPKKNVLRGININDAKRVLHILDMQ